MKVAFLSEQAREPLLTYLLHRGIRPIMLPPLPGLPAGIASHADLALCILGQQLWVAPAQYPYVIEQLPAQARVRVFAGTAAPGPAYPADISYNAAVAGRFFIHKLDCTDPALLQSAKGSGYQTIYSSQGYSKCSLVVVDEHSVITADQGLARALAAAGLSVLTVAPGYVALSGYPYGFLGGASGLSPDGDVLFHGNLSSHPDHAAICTFIEGCGKQVLDFPEFPLTDIGSVLFWGV